jgi:hypothetical protein
LKSGSRIEEGEGRRRRGSTVEGGMANPTSQLIFEGRRTKLQMPIIDIERGEVDLLVRQPSLHHQQNKCLGL